MVARRYNSQWLIVSLFVILYVCCQVSSGLAMDHSGGISSDETWYASDSPHNVIGDVFVSSGVTLTIEDGVHVLFPYHKYIRVEGNLVAIGTPGTGILFTQSTGYNWHGLLFTGSGSCDLEYCTIEYADYGFIADSAGTLAAENTTFRNCGYGIDASSSTVQLTSTNFLNNTTCGFRGEGVAPTFMDANNIFDNCVTGIDLSNISGLNLVTPVILSNNTSAGIKLTNCDAPTLDNFTVTGNAEFTVVYIWLTPESLP